MTGLNRASKYLCAIFCLSFLVYGNCFAQGKKSDCSGFRDSVLHKFVYKIVDKQPEMVGGIAFFSKLLNKNFKYPKGEEGDFAGKVIVAFVVEPNGRIDGKRTVKDPSGNERLFSSQLLRIVDKIKWTPGMCNGKAVPVLYLLPLNVDISE